jgi:hypothetical protein
MFIEGDPKKAKELAARYRATPDVICIEGFVYPTSEGGRKTLDDFCDEYGVQHIDFLSIDIDGLDLNIFESLKRRPTVIAIEGGFAWHPQMDERVPDDVAMKDLQQPLQVMVQAARAKDYVPICFNQNLYIIDSTLADKFEGIKHDAVSLWLDAYNDQSNEFRSHLSDFRKTHPLIHSYESARVSNLTVNVH